MKSYSLLAILGSLLVIAPCLRAADVSTEHGKDVVRVGSSISVGPDEVVGDAVCVGGSIHMAGMASGDLVAVGGSVQVDGTVRGDVVVVGGSLRLGPAAVVHGNVSLVGGKLQRDPAAKVAGEVSNVPMMGSAGGLAMLLFGPFLFMLVVGVVLSVLCMAVVGERRIETIVTALRQHTGLGLLAGLGVVAGFVVLVAVFHWTGPLAPLIWVLLCLALLGTAILGYTGVSAWVGHGLARNAGPMGALIAGALLVVVLQAVPVLGIFAVTIFGLLALGGAALSGLGSDPEWLAQRLSNRAAIPPAGAAGGR